MTRKNFRLATLLTVPALLCALTLSMAFAAAGGKDAKPAAPGKGKIDKKLEADIMARVQEFLKHRFSAVIKSVKPGAAKVGKPIPITVDVAFDDKRAIDKIAEVKIYYSTDGGEKWMRPVSLKKSGAAWSGNIPQQKAPGSLMYYTWVKDSYGKVTVELPCKVSTWPPADDKCMVNGAVDEDPKDDPTSKVPNNLDFWGFKVGMDDNYIYLQQTVEGSVTKGTTNPTNINSYMFAIFDVGLAKEIDDITAIMQPGAAATKFKGKENMVWMGIYSPLAKAYMPGVKKDCFMPRAAAGKPKGKEPQMPDMNTTMVECKSKGPDLFIRVKKQGMASSMKSQVALMGGITMAVTDTQNLMNGIKFGDFMNMTRAVMNPRTLKIN